MDGVTIGSNASSGSLLLVFGIHCHQPVGAPLDDLDRMADECYLPLLETFAEFSSFKFCLHFSGALLRQIESRRPALIDLVKKLAARRQVEVIGGAMYDAVLPALSETERIGQIRRFSDYLERLAGTRPKGLWLAEHAWEPHLCRAIQESGMDYVFLDDRHIAAAGIPEQDIHGVYLTEDAGYRIRVIANHDRLNAMIPGRPVRDVLRVMEERASAGCAMMSLVDAGEKFKGSMSWLRSFLSAIESSGAIRTSTPSEALAVMDAEGPIYLPAVSSGGIWRAFFSKHTESNWMHKRVCGAQQKMGPVLDKLGSDREARAIRDLLDRASCNDAYRRSIHVSRIRRATFSNLLEAENRFAKKMGLFPAMLAEDIDCDGHPELLVYVTQWVAAIKPTYGGGFVEWSYRPACYNFQNTLTRQPEPEQQPPDPKPKRIILFPSGSEPVDDAHLRDGLPFDRYRKCSGLLYAVDPGVNLQDWKSQSVTELVPANGSYDWKTEDKVEFFRIRLAREAGDFSFEKHIVISKHESKISFAVSMVSNRTDSPALLGFGFELFYGSCDRLSARVGETGLTGDLEGDLRGPELDIRDEIGRTRFRVAADGGARDACRFLLTPSYTVSKSGAGVEKLFQGLSILLIADAADKASRQTLSFSVDAEQI